MSSNPDECSIADIHTTLCNDNMDEMEVTVIDEGGGHFLMIKTDRWTIVDRADELCKELNRILDMVKKEYGKPALP